MVNNDETVCSMWLVERIFIGATVCQGIHHANPTGHNCRADKMRCIFRGFIYV